MVSYKRVLASAIAASIIPAAAFAAPASMGGAVPNADQAAYVRGHMPGHDRKTVSCSTPGSISCSSLDDVYYTEHHANPFSDVPADHWAYDAVAELGSKGVIEGYGDGTFQGDRLLTRYEMAQMVAKAMAKNPHDSECISLIEHLSAEFNDELSSLGVRVANLERNADAVKWEGAVKYTLSNNRPDSNKESNLVEFNLEPSAEVNDHWHAKARLTAYSSLSGDSSTKVELERLYGEGIYGNFEIRAGKIGFTDYSTLLFDMDKDSYSGAEAKYNFGNFSISAGAGRWEGRNVSGSLVDNNMFRGSKTKEYFADKANYQFISLAHQGSKLAVEASYHHLKSDSLGARGDSKGNANIWTVGTSYRPNDWLVLESAYANNTSAKSGDKSWTITVGYRGANSMEPGSWGLFAAYNHLGANTTFSPSFLGIEKLSDRGVKGYQFGGSYTPFQNVVLFGSYFNGKNIVENGADQNVSGLFGHVNFYF